jgi:hypothetical protein
VVGIDSHLFENGVGVAMGVASDIAGREARRPGPPRVGYLSGTTTHDDDWRHVEAAVVDALAARPGVELWLGGHLQPTTARLAALAGRVRHLPFTEWHRLPSVLRQLDVNLAPLEPGSRFNDAKSAIKWMEAALVATPTIASPSAPFAAVIEPGRTGWLANDPGEWRATLDAVLDDPDARAMVGARAQRAALLRWSPHLQGARYLAILEEVRSRAAGPDRRRPAPGWAPVVADEPPLASPPALEPYPPDLRGSTRLRRRPRRRVPVRAVLRQKRARLREAIEEEGIGGVVRGAGRVAIRAVRRGPRP